MEVLFSAADKVSGTSGWTEVAGGTGTPPLAKGGRLPDSAEDLLGSDAMESGTPPKAPSPKHVNDTEVSSQEDPGQGGGGGGLLWKRSFFPLG